MNLNLSALKLTNKRLHSLAIHVALIIICLVFLFPIYYIITCAIKPEKLITAIPPVWVFSPNWEHFSAAFQRGLPEAFMRSLFISLVSVSIGVMIASLSAYSIQRFSQKKVAFFVLILLMIPYIVCTIPLFILYQKINWFDTYQGLIFAYLIITIPQSIWILLGFVDSIPKEIEEAAFLDGCTRLRTFFKIILPLLKPGLMAAAVLSFIQSWNNFSLCLMLAGGDMIPAPLLVFNYVGEASIDWGGLAATATLMIIPVALFTICMQKYLVRGLMVGST